MATGQCGCDGAPSGARKSPSHWTRTRRCGWRPARFRKRSTLPFSCGHPVSPSPSCATASRARCSTMWTGRPTAASSRRATRYSLRATCASPAGPSARSARTTSLAAPRSSSSTRRTGPRTCRRASPSSTPGDPSTVPSLTMAGGGVTTQIFSLEPKDTRVHGYNLRVLPPT